MDVVGPITAIPHSNIYLLVLVDYFTKCCLAILSILLDSRIIADAILNH